ncbi:MAG: GntR family transcriptional regulator [Desulfovermiculus sp.]|nr:GntR family transcriptional regulator [Desulfovermiculus sp.]
MNKEIYAIIKNKILYLEYEPGQILNENVLAKEFQVSRTPMREVLYRLEWEDLVRILPRTGTMVTEIEFQKMMHTYQARRMELEELLGRLAAEQISSSQVGEITSIGGECRELTAHKDLKALAGIDFRFRNVLHEAAGNPVLQDVSEYLYTITFRMWFATMGRGDWRTEVQAIENEITETLQVLNTNDPAATGKVRHSHLVSHIERIQAKFLGSNSYP